MQKTRGSRLIDVGVIAKIFVIFQSEKVPISPRRNEISKQHCLSSRHPNRRKTN